MKPLPTPLVRSFEQAIRPRLLEIERPARYIGGEPGVIHKEWDEAAVHFALGFPDLYELGMSYHGREIIYQQLNARQDTACERVFLPAGDMADLMRNESVPLWTLESRRPVIDFDLLGISLTYELAYPAALSMLALSGIPLHSSQRNESHPLVIAGGQCMCNPEPVAPFFDVIVNGEGEEVIHEIVDTLLATRDLPRHDQLLQFAQIPGCYVPQFYQAGYNDADQFTGVVPLRGDVPAQISRRYVADLATVEPPIKPVQPFIEVPSDKAYIEVMRGCPQGCRFCQAGYITRPARARSVKQVRDAAAALAANTGADEVGLMSLSTLDHPQVLEMVAAVKQVLPPGVGVAMPSMRADAMSAELAEMLRRPRETSLTIAIEAGSDWLRQAINKRVTDSNIATTFNHLMQAGWHKFKLYFMCGFLHEDEAAIDGIADVVETILDIARQGGHRKPHLNVSVSVLVPKPHTPLQWQAMERPEITERKISHLRNRMQRWKKAVNFRWHDAQQSVIEALLARGGRELAPVLEATIQGNRGATGDDFDFAVWQAALERNGIDLGQQVYRERSQAEALPWEHIDRGVRRNFLWHEWIAYRNGEPTPPCQEQCTGCGLGCTTALFS